MNLNYKVNPSFNCEKYVKSHDENKFTSHHYSDSVVRANYLNCLISILFNTNNIKNTLMIINEFYKKTRNPKNIQFCIKIDNDDEDFKENFIQELSKFNFNFVILASPQGRGFVDLWQWVNFLYKSSSKRSSFVMNISDEMYISQKNWDLKLEKYIGAFKDDIFRLRTSVYKNRNYIDLYECGYAPDTTAIYTRKYLDIQGDFSPCFGPDNGQQFVAYYLAKLNLPRHYQFSRDIVSEGLDFNGQGTNAGLTKSQKIKRNNLNFLLWNNMFTYSNQNLYFKRARKIQMEILKILYKDLEILDYGYKYHLNFKVSNEKRYLYLKNYISKPSFFLFKISKLDFFKNNTGYHAISLKGYMTTIYLKIFKKFPHRGEENIEKGFFHELDKIFTDTKLVSYLLYFEKSIIDNESLKNIKSIIDIKRTHIHFILSFARVFLLFLFFYTRIIIVTIYFILYHLYNPKRIFRTSSVIINRIFKNQRLKSYIFTNDEKDQSKTIIVKGD